MVEYYKEYTWLVVVGAFASFGVGWGTGANDVANAFGTSVGAKTLTLKQAVVLACVFEFAGTLILSRVSTSTLAGGIADVKTFQREPELYAHGMVCAMSATTFWLILTSYLGYNVSTTHSIIGSIIGFALCYAGKDGVQWARPDKGSFPPYKGIVPIVVSWFASPVLTGLASALMFVVTRFLVLRRKNAYLLSFWILPPMVMLTVWVNLYFVFTKGAKASLSKDDSWTEKKAQWVAAAAAAGCTGISIFVAIPVLKWRAENHFKAEDEKEMRRMESMKKGEVFEEDIIKVEPAPPKPDFRNWDSSTRQEKVAWLWYTTKKAVMYGMDQDMHGVVSEDADLTEMHARAEQFDPKAEFALSYLQVFTAMAVIFAHGANDSAYAIGPLTGVWQVYSTRQVTSKFDPPIWIIFIGAFSLIIGLAQYGYNVTRTMGVTMAKLTPSRGFCAELATSLVIMVTSQYGLPTSSSQCIVGGIVGVGACEGKRGVNWRYFFNTFLSWVLTIIICGFLTAGLFAQAVYSPSANTGKQVMALENGVKEYTAQLYSDFNKTLNATGAARITFPTDVNGIQTSPHLGNFTTLNKTFHAEWKKFNDHMKLQTYDPAVMFNQLNVIMSMIQAYSMYVLDANVPAAQATCLPYRNCTMPRLVKTASKF